MEKVNILYLSDVFFEFGGAERNLYDIVKHLDKNKFTPFVFALQAGEAFKEFAKLDVYAKSLAVKRIYDLNGIKSLVALIVFLKHERIEVIVSYHEGSDILAVVAGKIAGIKTIISSRRDMGYKLNRRHIFIYKIINNYFTKIITVSAAVAEVISKRERVKRDKLITIYNGVDFSRTTPDTFYTAEEIKALKIEKDSVKVGVLSTFRRIKGLEYFIKAARLVKKRRDDVQFLVVGKVNGGENKYFEELKALSENTVTFIDFQKDIAKIINLLDIVVLPSLSEGFSNTLIEAMAAGKPVIATNVGGNPEAAIDGITGILVPPANERALAEAIIKLVDDKGLRIKLGIKGKEEVQGRFNLQKMIKANEALYLYSATSAAVKSG